jgi:hypothetical protein
MTISILRLSLISILSPTLFGCGSSSGELIEYTIHDEQVLDGAKAQIVQNVVVTPPVTETQLRDLLSYLYEKASKRRGFKHFSHPSHIFIRIYTSAEQAALQGYYIGMIYKVADQTHPNIQVSQRQLSLQHEPPAVAFGKSEPELRQIWNEIVAAERGADKLAEEKYPFLTSARDEDKFIASVRKQGVYADSLLVEFMKRVAANHNLNVDQLDSIRTIGIVRQWPLPSR